MINSTTPLHVFVHASLWLLQKQCYVLLTGKKTGCVVKHERMQYFQAENLHCSTNQPTAASERLCTTFQIKCCASNSFLRAIKASGFCNLKQQWGEANHRNQTPPLGLQCLRIISDIKELCSQYQSACRSQCIFPPCTVNGWHRPSYWEPVHCSQSQLWHKVTETVLHQSWLSFARMD